MFFILLNGLESVISLTEEFFSGIRVNLNIPIVSMGSMGIGITIGMGIPWIRKIIKPEKNRSYKVFHLLMKKPREVDEDYINEKTKINIIRAKGFVDAEQTLRRTAYQRGLQVRHIDESILNDQDMKDKYSLFLGCLKTNHSQDYDNILIAVRVFENTNDIQLNIFKGNGTNKIVFNQITQKEEGKEGEEIKLNSIVIDRMIENFNLFRREGRKDRTSISRSEIYGRLFDKILEYYYDRPSESQYVYALARRNKGEPLLHKYVGWGMEILGEVEHELNGQNMRHWILKGEVKKMKKFIEENYKTLEYIKHLNKLN